MFIYIYYILAVRSSSSDASSCSSKNTRDVIFNSNILFIDTFIFYLSLFCQIAKQSPPAIVFMDMDDITDNIMALPAYSIMHKVFTFSNVCLTTDKCNCAHTHTHTHVCLVNHCEDATQLCNNYQVSENSFWFLSNTPCATQPHRVSFCLNSSVFWFKGWL